VAHDELAGAVNVAAPEPLPHGEFMRALRAAWGVRIGLPATGWMASIGSWAMGTDPELVMKSRRVAPGRLPGAGFAFEHPTRAETAEGLAARG
jgi:NAD dependent epimerase/dehydratase family enzyme